jgi:2-oxoglutarate ferredoxin oxidoreductase subunit gamma
LRKEVLISGFGGQGVVLAGRALGLAAVYSDLNATMLISHGTETRGGYVRSQVVISTDAIDSPVIERPDIFCALSQAAYLKFAHLALNTTLLYDPDLVTVSLDFKTNQGQNLALKARALAKEELGSELSANMVFLGQIVKIIELVPLSIAQKAVSELSRRGREANLAALELGYNLVL